MTLELYRLSVSLLEARGSSRDCLFLNVEAMKCSDMVCSFAHSNLFQTQKNIINLRLGHQKDDFELEIHRQILHLNFPADLVASMMSKNESPPRDLHSEENLFWKKLAIYLMYQSRQNLDSFSCQLVECHFSELVSNSR